ncbi:hypothetical protein L1D61_06660 [Vibrio mediterranei]|nr:hypothetical protein [Vibrio mediterranei]
MDEKELLWKRYELNVNNYTKYLDFVLRLNLFYYGITGAIVSFYFSHNANGSVMEYSLLLPIFFSVGVFFLSIFGHGALKVSMKEIEWLTSQLSLNYYVRIDALLYIVKASAIFSGIVILSLGYVLCSSTL